jgi:hypothetical protein
VALFFLLAAAFLWSHSHLLSGVIGVFRIHDIVTIAELAMPQVPLISAITATARERGDEVILVRPDAVDTLRSDGIAPGSSGRACGQLAKLVANVVADDV